MRALLIACSACAACGGSDAKSDAPTSDAPPDARGAHLVAYASGYGTDIQWLDVSPDHTLAPVGSLAAFAAGPSFLAIAHDGAHLYVVSESTSAVAAYAIDAATGALTLLNTAPSGGSGPAHVSLDGSGDWLFVSNYSDGKVAVFPIAAGGQVGLPVQSVHAGTNAHMAITDLTNHWLFVPCLGSDYVAQYKFDSHTGMLTPNAAPHLATDAHAGPRHLAIAPDNAHAYLVGETASTLTVLALDSTKGTLAPLQTVSTRASGAGGTNTAAEIWVHPNGHFVYASNRGDDDIATFSIDPVTGMVAPVAHTPTGGTTPRDFALAPDGTALYAANQGTGTLTAFSLDPATGALAPIGQALPADQASVIGFAALPAN